MRLLALVNLLFMAGYVNAAQWSNTELQFAYGDLTTPDFVADKTSSIARTKVLTLQHASGWQYGDNFFFVDYLDDDNDDSFNNDDFYGELYLNFSLSKIMAEEIALGPVKDIGILLGANAAGDAKIKKFLPGVRFSWDLPGFAFLNSDFMGYQDYSAGVAGGGAPAETNSYIIDVNGLLPFTIGNQKFQVTGHVECVAARENEFGNNISSWVLAQPQFRWDMGNELFNAPGQLFLGIEYQYWRNKLGEKGTNDAAPQLLLVWQL